MTEGNLKANIPTHELKLENGNIVVFYNYVTTGESRELQKMIMEKGKFDATSGKVEDLPLSVFFESQEKAATFVIKEVKIGDETKPFEKGWLDALPEKIGNAVYDEINNITQMSQLDKDKKKDS